MLDHERLRRTTKNPLLAVEESDATVAREVDLLEGIRRALEDVEAGRVVPHARAMAELDAAIEAATSERR